MSAEHLLPVSYTTYLYCKNIINRTITNVYEVGFRVKSFIVKPKERNIFDN